MGLAVGLVAMAAGRAQSLLDGLSNVVGLGGMVAASRPPDGDHPHERGERVASMAIAGSMTCGVVKIVQGSWRRLPGSGEPEVRGLAFAMLGMTMAINAAVSRPGGEPAGGLEAICLWRTPSTAGPAC
ncbi:MAG TPA: cation transporter [Thermomicrobiales bacterium]|nr:cation transporter [Thermomicrobiales bacterium]